MHIGESRRKNPAAGRQDAAALANGFREISSDVGQRGEEQVSEIVAGEPFAGVKAILKEPSQQRFVFGKRHHAIANIAGRKNSIFAAQTARAAAVIGHGDDGGKVGDGTLRSRAGVASANYVFLQPAEQRRKTSAAAERDDTESAREFARLRCFLHERTWRRRANVERAKQAGKRSADSAILFRIEQFGEAWVFLKEGEVLIVTGVEAIFGLELDGHFEVGHG